MKAPVLPRIFASIAVLLTILAYLPALEGDFFSDDFVYVEGNENLRVPLAQCWKLFVSRANSFDFLPVRDLSYWIDMSLFGDAPTGYHAHNLLIYALTCVAVWFCTISLLRFFARYGGLPDSKNKKEWIAAAATVLFAVHPAHVESVAWISGRKELLAGFFCMLSLHLLASALLPARVDRPKLIGANLLFVLALLSKSTFMPLAFLAVILVGVRCESEGIRSLQGWSKMLLLAVPMLLLAVSSVMLSMFVGAETGILSASDFEPMGPSATSLAVRILGYLVEIALFPARLHLTYDVLQPGVPSVLALILGSGALIATAVGFVFLFKRQSIVAFGIVTFVLYCLPYLQIVPFKTWSLASERFVFFALYGFTLSLAVLLSRLPALPSILLLAVFAGGGIGATYEQSRIWADNDSLWMNNAERAPGFFVAQLSAVSSVLVPKHRFDEAESLALKVRDPFFKKVLLRYARGERAAAAGDWLRAEEEADWLAETLGTGAPGNVLFFIASVYEKQNQPLEAARHYHWAARRTKGNRQRRVAQAGLAKIQALHRGQIEALNREIAALPGNLGPAGTLANLEMELYFLEQAEASFQGLRLAHPGEPAIPYNLGLTYMRMEEHCLAATQIRAAIQAGVSGHDAWNNLGLASWRCKDFKSAASAFQEALASNPQYWHAAVNQGRMLLTQGEREKAKTSFLEAKARINLIGGSTEVVDSYLERVEKY